MDQLSLMANEAEAYAYGTKNATAEQVAVKAHARKRQSGSVLDIVPEGTPTPTLRVVTNQSGYAANISSMGKAPASPKESLRTF